MNNKAKKEKQFKLFAISHKTAPTRNYVLLAFPKTGQVVRVLFV
jgi:hypothetical protein